MSGAAHGLRWLWLAGAVVALDRLSKLWAVDALRLHEPVAVMPSFNLTLTRNTGAAFSLLSDAGGWQRWALAGLAVLVAAGIVAWMARLAAGERALGAGLALVLGGALGNLWDRVAEGAVVDFVDLYYAGWHWPAFNVADSAITVGALVVIALGWRDGRGAP